MGLGLTVGWLADLAAGQDRMGMLMAQATFLSANRALRAARVGHHREPQALAVGEVWSSAMPGYVGLHAVRRLAAWASEAAELPPPATHQDFIVEPFVTEFLEQQISCLGGSRLRERPDPPFLHLCVHADSEGLYVPLDFDRPALARPFLGLDLTGGAVGSSVRLLEECSSLARFIGMPETVTARSKQLVELLEQPWPDAPDWRRYGLEAYCLAQLVEGCRQSIRTGAALVFT